MNIILFGKHDPPASDGASCPVFDFLQGKPVEFTPELARALLEEFSAQEAFRIRLRQNMSALVSSLLEKATTLQPQLEVPYRETEAYDAGYKAGAYAQSTEAAQLAQEALNQALEGVAT